MAVTVTGETGASVPRNAEEASGNGVARAQTPLLDTAGKIAQNSDQQQRQKSATPIPAQVSERIWRHVVTWSDLKVVLGPLARFRYQSAKDRGAVAWADLRDSVCRS